MTDAAQAAAAGLIVEVDEAETEEVSEQPTDTTEQQEVEVEEIPAEIQRLLEEPEDEEDDFEPVAEEESYFDDEDVDALRRKLTKEQKRREYLEEVQRKSALKQARKDAERYFPHADLDSIEASSRRGFLKQAREQHERIKSAVDKATAKEREALEAEKTRLAAENRSDRAEAWGQSVESTGARQSAPAQRSTSSRNPEVTFLENTRDRLASGEIKL